MITKTPDNCVCQITPSKSSPFDIEVNFFALYVADITMLDTVQTIRRHCMQCVDRRVAIKTINFVECITTAVAIIAADLCLEAWRGVY